MVVNPLRIGIIVPAFNAEKYLEETLDSLLIQNHKIDVITVVDDGSTDQTPVIIRKYCRMHPNVRSLKLNENSGESKAVNIGWKFTDADLIGIVNSDDPQPQRWLSEILETIYSNSEYLFYYPDLMIINDSGEIIEKRILQNFSKKKIINQLICLPSAGTFIAKYKLPSGFMPRDESCIYPSDLLQYMTLTQLGNGLHVKNAWAQWRQHPTGLSQSLTYYQKYSSFISSVIKWIALNRSSLSYRQIQEIHANLFAQALNSLDFNHPEINKAVKLLRRVFLHKLGNPLFVFQFFIVIMRHHRIISRRIHRRD